MTGVAGMLKRRCRMDPASSAPSLANLVVTQLARVPGTAASYVGSAYTARPSANHADVVVCGPIP